MLKTGHILVLMVVLALATTAALAQVVPVPPVPGGCPALPGNTTHPYLGGAFALTPGALEVLTTVDYFTAAPPFGVCLSGNLGGTWWVTTPAPPAKSGFSLAGVGGLGWDELVIENANGDFTLVNPVLLAFPMNGWLAATAGGITCSEIRGGRPGLFKQLVWQEAAGARQLAGGFIGAPAGPCVPGGGDDLVVLPGAPTLARGPYGSWHATQFASFFPPAFADGVSQNVILTVPLGSVPLMSDWMLGIFLMLVILLASWMITRRSRRRAETAG